MKDSLHDTVPASYTISSNMQYPAIPSNMCIMYI